MEVSKNTIIVVLALLLIVAGGLFLKGNLGFVEKGEKTTITTQGQSEITTNSDFVSVYILIETLNNSAQVAKDENARISDDILTGLIKLGLERKDIETVNYNIYESYKWEGNQQKKEGFKVSNSLKLKIKDNNLIGRAVDVVIDNKGLVQNINFEISKETENTLKKEALTKAAQDAREKAEALAEGSRAKLGKLVELSTEDFFYNPYPIYARAEADDVNVLEKAVTNIQPRELTVTGNVKAVYEIR